MQRTDRLAARQPLVRKPRLLERAIGGERDDRIGTGGNRRRTAEVKRNVVVGRQRELLGFRPFPSRGVLVTNELVEQIREEEGV